MVGVGQTAKFNVKSSYLIFES